MFLNIPIPAETDMLIKEGDRVDFQTPLYKGRVKKDVKVPLAHMLNINSKKIFTVLKKFVGEEIKKGDVVAFHSGVFTRKRYVSEHNGVIREVNHTEGYLIIESETDQSRDKSAWFKGEIAKITKDENGKISGIDLKVEDTKKIDAKTITNDFGGKISFVNRDKLQTVSEDDVNGCVIVTESPLSYELVKLETLGAAGIITIKQPKDKPLIPYGVLEKPEDIKEFDSEKYPYCIVNKNKGTIHLYR